MAVHAVMSLGLDLEPGMKLVDQVHWLFKRTMHPDGSGDFILVVSFVRHSFRLDEDSVSLALESAIGGYCSKLKVSRLQDQVFPFHVSCKDVGFFIFHQCTFVCPKFHCL